MNTTIEWSNGYRGLNIVRRRLDSQRLTRTVSIELKPYASRLQWTLLALPCEDDPKLRTIAGVVQTVGDARRAIDEALAYYIK